MGAKRNERSWPKADRPLTENRAGKRTSRKGHSPSRSSQCSGRLAGHQATDIVATEDRNFTLAAHGHQAERLQLATTSDLPPRGLAQVNAAHCADVGEPCRHVDGVPPKVKAELAPANHSS